MSDKPPSLELLTRQQQQMLDEFAAFRDQLTVLTAICMRVERKLENALVKRLCKTERKQQLRY